MNEKKVEEKKEEVSVIVTDKEQKIKDVAIPTMSNSEVANVDTDASLFFVKNLEALKVFAKGVIAGALCPLKKEEDIIIAITSGRELGLQPMVSIQNIYPINGKPAISTHIVKALLLNNDVMFRKTIDYKPIFIFYKEQKNEKGEIKKVGAGKGFLEEKPVDAKHDAPVDFVTEYEFSRFKKRINGSWHEIIVPSRFSMKEAQQAELLDKDNYKKYPARMLDARAFIIGAREIASDIIFGMYSINELADSNNIKYDINENSEEKIIDITNNQ